MIAMISMSPANKCRSRYYDLTRIRFLVLYVRCCGVIARDVDFVKQEPMENDSRAAIQFTESCRIDNFVPMKMSLRLDL
jgi:hypothetical protein